MKPKTREEIEEQLSELEFIPNTGSLNEFSGLIIAREQVYATLLLEKQVKRIADLLQEKIEEDAASDNLSFAINLFKRDK